MGKIKTSLKQKRFYLVAAAFLSMVAYFDMVSAPTAQAACSALPSDKGQVSATLSVPMQASYRVWARVYAPSASANGFYLQIDQSLCGVQVGKSASIPAGQLTWVDYQSGTVANKINATLSSGNHMVTLAGLDNGVGVDKIMLIADPSCVPIGFGDNCTGSSAATATPTPGSSPTPSPTVVPGVFVIGGGGQPAASSEPVTVSGELTLQSSGADAGKVTYKLDGKIISGNKIDTGNLSNGFHVIEKTVTNADGTIETTSQKIKVSNSLLYILGARIKSHLVPVLFGLVALAGIIFGIGFVLYRKGVFKRIVSSLRLHKTTPADLLSESSSITSE